MFLDKVIINKSGNKGEATVYLGTEDCGDLVLNKFQIDLSDGSNPVNVLKANGIPMMAGTIIDGLKEEILNMFNSIKEYRVGIFEFTDEGVCKLGE